MENLVRHPRINTAGSSSCSPGKTARCKAAAGVLPGRGGLRLNCPVRPTPLAASVEVHADLHRNPVSAWGGALGKHDVRRQENSENTGHLRIWRLQACCNRDGSRETRRVIVEVYIERGCRPRAIKISPVDDDLLDSPCLARRHDEIISRLIVKRGISRRKLLRIGSICSGTVRLVIKDSTRGRLRGWCWRRGWRR